MEMKWTNKLANMELTNKLANIEFEVIVLSKEYLN